MDNYKRLKPFSKGLFTDLVKGIAAVDTAVNKDQALEAEEHGLTLLNRSNNYNYNFYKFNKCGHTQFAQPTHVRRNQVKCSTCELYESVKAAEARGAFLLNRASYAKQTYLLPCGHVGVSSGQTLKQGGDIYCKQCFDDKVKLQADQTGIEILETIGSHRKLRFSKCGHEKTAHFSQIFKDNLVCRICKENEFKLEAEAENLTYLGMCDKSVQGYKEKRTYELPCGHHKALRTGHVRSSNWQCDICDDSHYLKPSFVYLLQIDLPIGSFAKLGYARNVESRIQGYGITEGSCKVVKKVSFSTGREASQFERELHNKYKPFNANRNVIGQFMQNGKTECYSIDVLSCILEELERISNG